MVAVPAAALHHLSAMGGSMMPPQPSSAMAQSLSHLTAGAALLHQVPSSLLAPHSYSAPSPPPFLQTHTRAQAHAHSSRHAHKKIGNCSW